jgi:peptide/nickel transport system permease protein
MIRLILTRLALGVITLWILSVIVFLGTQVLPGNPGRAIRGPFASEASVRQTNHDLGVDRHLYVQYGSWIGKALTGDLGKSFTYSSNATVTSLLGPALKNSLKLAVLSFVLVVPLGILGGVVAAMRKGQLTDRLITILGLSAAVMPEFVSGIVLIVIFGLWLKVLPVTAQTGSHANVFTQIEHLLMPALALVLVLFGYIARMARAGTITALDADYTRTAYLKGLSRRTVIRRHVLRNALLPTITVIATQTGYLIGGLVIVERLFNYNGIGQLIAQAATQKDYPLLESGVLIIGLIYMVATLTADVLYAVLNPRIRYATPN